VRIAVIFNAVSDQSSPDEQDVIVQAESVAASLKQLGHQSELLGCDLDLSAFRLGLEKMRPDVVFNLVESLGCSGRLIHLVPSLLDVMGIPYTGSPSESIYVTSHKVMAKQKMSAAGLPTPYWIGPYPYDLTSSGAIKNPAERRKENIWIVKSVWEHASMGLDDHALITESNHGVLIDHLKQRCVRLGGACFAEQYIEGREFNLSLLAGPHGPDVLPPAEILFEGYQNHKPRIVGYRAKWDEQSFDYHHTSRSFDFSPDDGFLLAKLQDMAIRCWRLFGLGGYARIDFRVDYDGNPWILEVNANPCLSPDAGFAAAVSRSGMRFSHAVERILDHALTSKTHNSAEAGWTKADNPVSQAVEKRAMQTNVSFRYTCTPQDIPDVRQLVSATGFFNEAEVELAAELVAEWLSKGKASGYGFVFVNLEGRLAGYSCYGPIPCSASSFDLYWIAVHPDFQKKGLGKVIFNETEHLIREAGGTRMYVDTSQRPQYHDTQAFYEHCGLKVVAVLEDFYALGENKVIYAKSL
jgi:D-alanine-D-alanine ligase